MKKWEPTPEVKALHDKYFKFGIDLGLKDENVIAVVEGDTIHFPTTVARNGRLCCEHNGMWYILGTST